MGIASLFASIWRDWITDGVPSSGVHRPPKADIRDLGVELARRLDPVVVTANYAARAGEILLIDSSAGPITISAHATPTEGQAPITLIDHKGTWSTNNVTFDPGAVPIAVPGAADATGLVCSDDYAVAAVGYAASKYRVL